MQWQMNELESVLEKIWDLHDKVSDAIHSISRSRFLKSIGNGGKTVSGGGDAAMTGLASGGPDRRSGFVFVKGFDDSSLSMAEARSLNAIRAALEDLEDQLEFFHTVQSQQQAERDSAIARLEQSRAILSLRLSEHQGKKYKVIEEALNFLSSNPNFTSPEDLSAKKAKNNNDGDSNRGIGVLVRGVLGNVAVFAISVLALIQINQMVFRGGKSEGCLGKKERGGNVKSLDVFLARG